jgi:hypothetical protein
MRGLQETSIFTHAAERWIVGESITVNQTAIMASPPTMSSRLKS